MLSILSNLAQTSYDYSYTTTSSTNTMSSGAALGLFLGIFVAVIVIYLFFSFCMFKIFKKANRTDAWAAFVPLYNQYVYYEIAGRPGWWAFLGFIPFVGGLIALVTGIIGSIDLAKSFGKSGGFAALLVLLPVIAYPMLAFGDATYQGPAGPEGASSPIAGAQPMPAQPQVNPVTNPEPATPESPQDPTQPSL